MCCRIVPAKTSMKYYNTLKEYSVTTERHTMQGFVLLEMFIMSLPYLYLQEQGTNGSRKRLS